MVGRLSAGQLLTKILSDLLIRACLSFHALELAEFANIFVSKNKFYKMFHEESLPEEVFLATDLLRRNKNWKLPYKFDSNDLEGR